MKDMVRAYLTFLEAPGATVDRQAFNVGYQNRSVEDIARMVRETLGDPTIELEYVPSDDLRSYHVNSDKIKRVLGFATRHTIEDAIRDVADAYLRGLIYDPLKNPLYSNIKRMQLLKVK
jgi:nucleoside-diphosphate-sugar epimerase